MALALIAAHSVLAQLGTRLLLLALVNVQATLAVRVQAIAIEAGAHGAGGRGSALVLAHRASRRGSAGRGAFGTLVMSVGTVSELVAHPRHVHTLAILAVEKMWPASPARSAPGVNLTLVVVALLLVAVQLIAAVAAVPLPIATELPPDALTSGATLELVYAAHIPAIGLILATGTLGGAIAAHSRWQADLQIARALVLVLRAGYVHRRCIHFTVQFVRSIATVVVAIAHQTPVQTLAQLAAVHVRRTAPVGTLVVLIRSVAAVDPSVAFPAARDAGTATALEHARFASRGCLARGLIGVVAAVIGAIADQARVHALAIVAGVLVDMTLLGLVCKGNIIGI